jgi:hypothetical protein
MSVSESPRRLSLLRCRKGYPTSEVSVATVRGRHRRLVSSVADLQKHRLHTATSTNWWTWKEC